MQKRNPLVKNTLACAAFTLVAMSKPMRPSGAPATVPGNDISPPSYFLLYLQALAITFQVGSAVKRPKSRLLSAQPGCRECTESGRFLASVRLRRHRHLGAGLGGGGRDG